MSALAEVAEECKRLRALLCECARAVGARVEPSASLEFMGEIPGEVRIAYLRARGQAKADAAGRVE